MASAGFLKNKVMYSPLASQSSLRPQNRKGKRTMASSLMLTSLVDAFSILVIFLMMNSASQNSDFQADKVQLPKASTADFTLKTATVKLHGTALSVNDVAVSTDGLAAELKKIRDDLKAAGAPNTDSLVIIADRDQDFITLNPIIVAGSRVGFSEFKFAVEKQERK
jgi:biopolymer transport protein ExbD